MTEQQQGELNKALIEAVSKGNVDECQRLIQAGANVNATIWLGRTPLHLAAFNGHFEVCRLLIQAGANVNTMTSSNWTPLHCAAWLCHLEVCQLLIEQGADVHATDWFGWTPLDLVIGNHAVEILAYFYVHGVVDFHLVDHTGRKPWDRLTAQQQGTLTEAMAEHREKIGILQTKGLPIELARLVMGYV